VAPSLELPDGAFAPRTPSAAARARRRRLLTLVPVVAVVAVLAVFAGTQGSAPSARPDRDQAQAMVDDPCGILTRAELGPSIGELTGDFTASLDGGIARCEHRGLPDARVLLVEISLAAGDAAGRLAAQRELAEAAPVRLADLGDEAWTVRRGVDTVWARQGELLVGVAVVPRRGDTDIDASRRVAAILLNLAASVPT